MKNHSARFFCENCNTEAERHPPALPEVSSVPIAVIFLLLSAVPTAEKSVDLLSLKMVVPIAAMPWIYRLMA